MASGSVAQHQSSRLLDISKPCISLRGVDSNCITTGEFAEKSAALQAQAQGYTLVNQIGWVDQDGGTATSYGVAIEIDML